MKLLRYTFVIILVYLAISLTAARMLVANLENNISYFESYLTKYNVTNIDIKKITTNWLGLYPSIEIFLGDTNKDKDKNKFYTDNIKINVNIYKSVILFKPVINEIFIKNIYYKTSIEEISGYFKNKNFENNLLIENIKIKNSNLSIRYNKKIFNINNANISIKKDSFIINSNIDSDKKFLGSVKNIEIKNSKLINFDYKIKINGIFDYLFENILNKHNLEVNSSGLTLFSSGTFLDGKLINNKFSILTNKKSSFTLNSKVINNINAEFIFDGNINNNFEFEINKLNFFSKNNNYYTLSDFSGNYTKENSRISIFSKKLDVNLKNIFNDYGISFKNDLIISGLIENFKLKLNLQNIYKEFYVAGNFLETNISSDAGYIKNFSGFIESTSESTFIRSNSKNVDIEYNSVFRINKSYDFINGDIKITNYSKPLLNVYDLNLINDEIDINTTGIINFSNDSIRILSKINSVDMTKITDYIPLALMKEKSSSWFRKSFLNGYSKNAYVLVDGKLSNYPFYDKNDGISYAIFPIYKLAIDYKKNWVPFKNIDGLAYFNKRQAQFYSEDFNVLNTKVINAALEIDNIKNIELILKGNLNGPFNDLLKYSNTASLTKISNEKINKINGISNTDFRIKIAFNNSKNDYRSIIKLNNIDFKIDKNNILSKINGEILFKNNLFFTEKNKYINAKYNNRNIIFSLDTLSDNSFIVSGVQQIDISKNITNKIYQDKILGTSQWNYKLIIPGFNSKSKKISLSGTSDLYGTSVNLPKPLGKNNDIRKNISVDAVFDNNKLHDINIIYNGIYAEISSLEKSSGYINFSGKKLMMPNNRFNLVGKLDTLNLSDWKSLNTNSAPVDYFDYINKIDLSIVKLINNNIILDNFSIKGHRSNKTFVFSQITAKSDKVKIVSNGKIEFNNISSFKINLNSENLERLLNYWKFNHSLRDSSINSDFDLSWQGGLFDFNLDKIYGEFTTVMTNGRLKKIGNRATRIFGLFNIDLLAKRLSLDFDDVTKNGFFYNSLSGDFRIESGNIFTTNLIIKGPSAEILAVGTTDIINETYDMQVVASPEFGEALPAIALLGGPITAAATFAAEKLAKAFGKDINDLIKIKYKVSGPWDNPVLKIIDKKGNALENVEDLFK